MKRFASILWVALALGGCLSSTQEKLSAPQVQVRRVTSFEVVKEPGSIEPGRGDGWEPDFGFGSSLESTLRSFGFAADGDRKLVVRFKIEKADEGSRGARFLLPFVAGTGTFVVWTRFEVDGKEIATFRTTATIYSGFYGGSYVNVVDRASYEVAERASKILQK